MPEHIRIKSATWLQPILRPGGLEAEAVKAADRVGPIEYEAIAFTGLSGAVLSSALAMKFNKLLYCVRKSGENRHSDYEVEGPSNGLRYIIVDDLINSGDTVRRINAKVAEHTSKQAVCVGIYLYREDRIIVNQKDLDYWTGKIVNSQLI